jgi:hypothetical protein
MSFGTPTNNTLKEHNGVGSPIAANVFTGAVQNRLLVVQASIYTGGSGVTDSFAVSSVTDGTNSYTVRSAIMGVDSSYKQREVIAWAVVAANGNYTPSIALANVGPEALYALIQVSEFSGVDTAAPEVTYAATNHIDLTSNDITGGPITMGAASDLIVGCAGICADNSTSLAWVSPSSWTNISRQNDGYTTGTGHESDYWLPGSIQTSYSPQWGHRNFSNEGASIVVVFKAASAGGGPIELPTLTMPPMRSAGRR